MASLIRLGCFAVLLVLVCSNGAGAQPRPRELFTRVQLTQASSDQLIRVQQLREAATTRSLELVRIDAAALQGATTLLSLPDGAARSFTRKSVERTGTSTVWQGTLPGTRGNATLVVHGGQITGTIHDGDALYRVQPVSGGIHALVRIDTAKFPPDEPPSFVEEQRQQRGDATAAMPRGVTPRETAKGPVEITVMVAYTAAAKEKVADMEALIVLAVAEANQSYVNSAINIKLKLVKTFEYAGYDETGKDFDTELADFGDDDVIHKLRVEAGADLSAVIIENDKYCGLGYLTPKFNLAYAAVSYSCATGYYSFAHELGHNMGARHEPSNDPGTTPFPFGHGYQMIGEKSWRTIMSYNCPKDCPRLQYWSNPNIKYNGLPMGTAEVSDNARVLNARAAIVAQFHIEAAAAAAGEANVAVGPSPAPPPPAAAPPVLPPVAAAPPPPTGGQVGAMRAITQ